MSYLEYRARSYVGRDIIFRLLLLRKSVNFASGARCTLLVVRRKLGESLLLGGSVLVTVSLITETFVELTVQTPSALPCCVTASLESLRSILPGVQVIAIRIDLNSARLAFELPEGMTLERAETHRATCENV